MHLPRPRTAGPARIAGVLLACTTLLAVVAPAGALGAKSKPTTVTAVGKLTQLPGTAGCLVDQSQPGKAGCTTVRALRAPAPFLGSEAVTLSPDGRQLYVASSGSDAIAIFQRDATSGKLTQSAGPAGCISSRPGDECALAVGLAGPNSVAVSPDGTSVYATSLKSEAVTAFHRDATTGALSQAADGTGCISRLPLPGCTTGRAVTGPDVVRVSPDGRNVYVGAFFGNAVAVFNRDATTGALTQPADATGCIGGAPADGCTTGLALNAVEGLAVSADGASVYAASAVSNAVVVLARNPSTGALTQAADGSGCIVNAALTGCTTGRVISGANAVTVSPTDTDVYVTSLLSNTLTSFTRSTTGQLVQKSGTTGCAIYIYAVGCSLGHALSAPEGLAVSPDGANVYVAAFTAGSVDVFDRDATTGAVMQKPRSVGCIATSRTPNCTRGRAMMGVSSLAVSADGKYVYAGANGSNAVGIFKRVTKAASR